jgi:hypothetical protein
MSAEPTTLTEAAPPLEKVAPEALADAWASARADSAGAYCAWCGAAPNERRGAYAAYLAAADREDVAQDVFLTTTRDTERAADDHGS